MEDGNELVVNTGQLFIDTGEPEDSITVTNATDWKVIT